MNQDFFKKDSCCKLILLIIIAGWMETSNIARADEIEQPQRMSIAISGGASKGAYEAGLNWGILKIMRDVSIVDSELGGQYRPFEPASFAGASAGGINTLLSGLVWCTLPESEGGLTNRIDDNIFRDVWLIPDVNSLLPPRAESPHYLPDDAVLSRRDLVNAARELLEKWNTPSFRKGCTIPLGVTVTKIIPETLKVGSVEVQNQRFYIPFELRVQSDNTVKFFFDPANYPALSDPAMILMPRRHYSAPFSIDDELVLDAILTTSAFPLGFGRKRLQYCGQTKFSLDDEGHDTQDPNANLPEGALLCPQGYVLKEAEFADGGLFDNLPVGLARILAELHVRAMENTLPVTYIYLDPNRVRYEIPEAVQKNACRGSDPPEACREMEFSFFTESEMLTGAMGTARKFELYRELTGENWSLNMSELSYGLADFLADGEIEIECRTELPFFDRPIDCSVALRLSGRLLERAYDSAMLRINEPFSVEGLKKEGVAKKCRRSISDIDGRSYDECAIDALSYRQQLASALVAISTRLNVSDKSLVLRINRSRLSMYNDRILRVSSRGAPITGTLLGSFGAFLEYKFREYDYYVGIYDAIVLASKVACNLPFSQTGERTGYEKCLDEMSNLLFDSMGLNNDVRGRYVFALLARKEFQNGGLLLFAYEPMPAEDHDMYIIHEGLKRALEAGYGTPESRQSIFSVEIEFFNYLKDARFVPTPTDADEVPLLTQIMNDPDNWSYELTRRFSSRLVYLEKEAKRIYEEREPDPEKREEAYTSLMGATTLALQAVTYKYPDFDLAPSAAPSEWFWRYVIPYEISFDVVAGDLLLVWQPTWNIEKRSNLGIRGSFGLAGGLFRTSADREREYYFSLGLDFTRLMDSDIVSSWGVTSGWFHTWTWDKPRSVDQDSMGFDIHVGFLENRIRAGLGARNVKDFHGTWFLTLGIADIPGFVYWLFP